jgi:Uma2 family endonuclease
MTAEEFYATCLLERAELVNGEVIEKIPPGYRHGRLAASFALRLGAYVLEHGLGEVLTETGYRLSSNPDVVRSPDVSFLAADRVPDEEPDSFFEGPPTLAIEVVSPGDLAGEVEAKVQEYLAAGTLAVWVVHPKTRSIKVRTANETRVYSRTETLSGEPVLPGFEMVVSEILR